MSELGSSCRRWGPALPLPRWVTNQAAVALLASTASSPRKPCSASSMTIRLVSTPFSWNAARMRSLLASGTRLVGIAVDHQ